MRPSSLLAVAALWAIPHTGLAADEAIARQLAERDATIAALSRQLAAVSRRLDVLEHKAARHQPPPRAESSAIQSSATGHIATNGTENNVINQSVLQTVPPPALDLSEEDIGRALETNLLQQGAYILSPWSAYLVPSFSYSNQRSIGLIPVPDIGTTTSRVDTWNANLIAALGLPYGFQVQVALPYVVGERARVTVGNSAASRSSSGLGDIQLGLSKQVYSGGPWLPAVIAGVTWKTNSGFAVSPTNVSTSRLAIGNGWNSLVTSVTATKRADPLVYFGSLSYSLNFPTDIDNTHIEPANTFGLTAGAALGLSPTTALSTALNLGFSGETLVNHQKVFGSDNVNGVVSVGLSTILTAGLILNAFAGFGITPDAPNFQVGLSFPIHF